MTTVQSDSEVRQPGFERLIEWSLEVSPDALPPQIIERSALLVADNLVALLAAAGDPGVARAQTALRHSGPSMGTPAQAAADMAVALAWMELDEGYAKASCHGGLYSLPVLAALASDSQVSVRTVLGQLCLTYEVVARLALAYPAHRFTWHPHAMWSSIGAAMARCRAESVEPALALRSLRIASTFAMAGGYEAAIDGAEVRNIWAAQGITQGFLAVDLARSGLDGPSAAPEGIYSRITGRDRCDDAIFTSGLGVDWAIFDSFTKPYACCQSSHSAISAVVMMRVQKAFSLDELESVDVTTPRIEMDCREPQNRLAAQFSLPHAVAAALVLGRADADAFALDAIADPLIARLRRAIRLVPWSAPLQTANARPAHVRLRFRGGEILEQTLLDAAVTDLAARREAVIGKLTHYADKNFPRASLACRQLVEGAPHILDMEWEKFAADWK